jgi:hypothetical protein
MTLQRDKINDEDLGTSFTFFKIHTKNYQIEIPSYTRKFIKSYPS